MSKWSLEDVKRLREGKGASVKTGPQIQEKEEPPKSRYERDLELLLGKNNQASSPISQPTFTPASTKQSEPITRVGDFRQIDSQITNRYLEDQKKKNEPTARVGDFRQLDNQITNSYLEKQKKPGLMNKIGTYAYDAFTGVGKSLGDLFTGAVDIVTSPVNLVKYGVDKLKGQEYKPLISTQKWREFNQEHLGLPEDAGKDREFAKGVGYFAGDVAQMLGTGGIVKGAGVAANVENKMAQKMVDSALTGGANAFLTGAKQELTPEETAKNMLRDSMFYAAGSGISDKVGQVAEQLMFKYGLQNKVALELAKNAAQGLSFDIGGYSTTLPTYPMMGDTLPSAKDVAYDMALGAIFDLVPNVSGTLKISKNNKQRMDVAIDGLRNQYEIAAKLEKNTNDPNVLNTVYDAMLRNIDESKIALNENRIVGEDKRVGELTTLLDRTAEAIRQRQAFLDRLHEPIPRKIEEGSTWFLPQGLEKPKLQTKPIDQSISTPSKDINKPIEKAEGTPLEYGKQGKLWYKKWGENELISADLANETAPYTKQWKQFFDKWYGAGREGINKRDLIFNQDENDTNFPPFLQDELYRIGEKDRLPISNQDKNVNKPIEEPKNVQEQTKEGEGLATIPDNEKDPIQGKTEANKGIIYFKNGDIIEKGEVLEVDDFFGEAKVKLDNGRIVYVEERDIYHAENDVPQDKGNISFEPGNVVDQKEEATLKAAYEKETQGILNERHKEVYDYLKEAKTSKKSVPYFFSEELEGIDQLKTTLKNVMTFTGDKSAAKLDRMQMEMANTFPEVADMKMDEFAQFLVDNVKMARSKGIAEIEEPGIEEQGIEEAAVSSPGEAGNKTEGAVKIAEHMEHYLQKEVAISPNKLYEIADKAFNGTMAQHTYEVKDAYDALELSINRHILNTELDADPKKAIGQLEKMTNLLPTQTKRSDRTESYQQYSTPPALSYVANYVANVTQKDTVLEPSAGIGGLAIFAKKEGAKVYVNELEPTRLSILKTLGFDEAYSVDAEQLNNLLPDHVKPSVILMNPPFSSAPERMKSKTDTSNAKRHVEQALDRLEKGGRLVLIVGEGMRDDAPRFKNWYNDLRKENAIRCNLTIGQDTFKKYGTSYKTQLIVIDKTGPQVGETLVGEVLAKELNKLPKLLEGIRNDRTRNQSDAVIKNDEGLIEVSGRNGAISTTSSTNGLKDPSARTRGEAKTTTGQTGSTRTDGSGKGVSTNDTTTGAKRDDLPTSRGTQKGKTSPIGDADRKQPGSKHDKLEVSNKTEKEIVENEDDVYSVYRPKKLAIKGAKNHVSDLVESAAMAAVEPPNVTYTPSIDKKLIESGALSLEQLENIVYSGQAHEQVLKNGERKGYFIGDGTGVGKGRQAAGIIIDNFNKGRTKAVWVSKNIDLFTDACRDWEDLGQDKNLLFQQSKAKAGNPIMNEKGVLFTTYDTIKSVSKSNPAQTRLQQIIDWFGKDYDGVIIFDEAHNMGNALDVGMGLGKKKASEKALAGINLQKALPNARIVYASATGATDVNNLAYLTRLGLWGPGTAFSDVKDFIDKIGSGGLAAMELVARDMKAQGVYLSRSISFKGVEYDTLEHTLSPMQNEIYNSMCKGWQKTLQNIDKALEITGANKNGRARASAKSQFYSSMQRFYNQILTSMAMPSVIEDMKKEIEKGNCCVLQIVNTNEATSERQIAKMEEEGLELEDLDLTPSDILIGYLQKSFPIHEFEVYTDDEGNERSRLVTDKEGNPVVSKKAVQQRDELIEEIKSMKVPDGPLEMLFDAFGVENIAEITGRKRRVITKDGKRIIEKRAANAIQVDAKAFQDDKKRILIFSPKGDTGMSYHADVRAINQRRRIHYLIQTGWQAMRTMQGFGRTHRSNQVIAPIFRLVTTNVLGQKRFTSTIAKRLDQLGALTKGQREAGSGVFGQKDNLECDLACDALNIFYKNLGEGRIAGYSSKEGMGVITRMGLFEKLSDERGTYHENPIVSRDMGTFLNRILCLEVEEQNTIFEQFYNQFETLFDKAVAEGTLDMGLENVTADKIEVKQDSIIHQDEKTGTKTNYLQIKVSNKPKILTYDTIKKIRDKYMGLYKDEKTGAIRAVYQGINKTQRDGSISESYVLLGPAVGTRSEFIKKTFDERMKPISKKEERGAWQEEIAKVPEYMDDTLHMLTGTLLPIWNKLPQHNTRVKRVVDDKGNQYLGRVISPNDIGDVLKRFGVGRVKETYKPQDIYDRVLKGQVVTLEREGLKLVKSKVSNEWRIEIEAPRRANMWYYNRYGVYSEKIQYETRYFIPTGAEGVKTLEKLLGDNPVMDIDTRLKDSMSEERASISTAGGPPLKEARGTYSGPAMKVSEIIAKMNKDFDVTLKNRPSRGTTGTYNTRTYTIRLKKCNDIGTYGHELGHKLDAMYELNTPPKDKIYKEELLALGGPKSKESYSITRKKEEGVAEFTRLYLTDKEQAKKVAPLFYKRFEDTLDPNVLQTFNKYQEEVEKALSLDAVGTVINTIRFDRDNPLKKLIENMKELDLDKAGAKLKAGLIDESYVYEWLANKVGGKEFSKEVRDERSRLSGYAGTAEYQVFHAQTDFDGKGIGPSLNEILGPIYKLSEEDSQKFWAYAVAMRSQDYFNHENKQVTANGLPSNWETYNKVIEELGSNPTFKKAFQELVKFSQNELLKAVHVGRLSMDQYKEIIKKHPNYIPLNRSDEAFDHVVKSSKGRASQAAVKSLRGGGQDIENPHINIVRNLYKSTRANMDNYIWVLLDMAQEQAEGVGRYMEKPNTKMKMVNAEQLAERLVKQLEDLDMEYALGIPFEELELATKLFTPNNLAGHNQVNFYREGKMQIRDIDPFVYQYINMTGPQEGTLYAHVVNLFSKFTKLKKSGVVTTPAYIKNNLTKDTFGSLVLSRAGLNFIDPLIGVAKALSKGENYQRTMLYGAQATFFNQERNHILDDIEALTLSQNSPMAKAMKRLREPLRTATSLQNRVSEPIEMACRIQEFEKTIVKEAKKAGVKGKNNEILKKVFDNPGQYRKIINRASYNAADLSINHNTQGAWIRQLGANRMISFFASTAKGLYKMPKNLFSRETWWKTILRGAAAITVPMFVNWLMNRNDEDYQDLEDYLKDSYLLFKQDNGDYFKISLQPEVTAFFWGLPRRILEREIEGDKAAFDDYADTLINTFTFNQLLPDAVSPLYRLATNKQWNNYPVLNTKDLNSNPIDQVSNSTSSVGIGIANATQNLPVPDALKSPKQIDFLIKEYTGTWGQVGLYSTDQLTGRKEGIPLVGPLANGFTVKTKYSSKAESDYYDYKSQITKDYLHYKLTGNSPRYNVVYYNDAFKVANKRILKLDEMINAEKSDQARIDDLERQKKEIMKDITSQFSKATH